MEKYNKGSEWRKWDLHVHSPYTHLNKYSCTSHEFINKIKEENISVVGLTNYFNFKEEEYVLKEEMKKEGIAVFLNLELRLSYQNKEDDCTDIHVIFDNNLTDENIKDFLTNLKLNLNGKEVKAKDISTNNDFTKATVEFDNLLNTLNDESLNLKDKYLIGFLSRGKGNARSSTNYEKLTTKSHFLIHSSDSEQNLNSDREFWLEYNKPLLQSSDAHDLEQIGIKYSWIKADPTFEGLKQVIYEPEDRVEIQESIPDEKDDYQIIDKVQFIDDSFLPNEIFVSQNLTTIIGGKSTGKSILLRNIAETIDKNEVSSRLKEVNITQYSNEVSDFQVIWRDKQKNEKNKTDEVNKKIIYIPQSYLNRLVDRTENESSIDKIIKDVLIQDRDINNVFENLQNKHREIEQNISENIEQLFYKETDIKDLKDDIKKIGDKKGIELEIEKIKKEVSDLRKKSGMTDEEIKVYNDSFEKITQSKKDKELKEKSLNSLSIIQSEKKFGVFPKINEQLDLLELDIKESLKNSLKTIIEDAEEKWNEEISKEYKKIEEIQKNNSKELDKLYKIFNPLLEKAKESKSFDEKAKKLEIEKDKLKKIVEQEGKLEKAKKDYDNLIKFIIDEHSKFYRILFDAKSKILEQNIIKDDLEFEINIPFKNQTFKEDFIDTICNLRSLSGFENGFLQDYIRLDNANFEQDIEKIIKGIINNDLSLKSAYSRKEALLKLMISWFSFDYQIKQNGDQISEMSPGKKSFVLLKLLIELDNSKCPILLDQPEDDLDNRSIYNDLVKFIKTKKKERQIIIATHNPNLVVGADSECVIVANQNGDTSKNRQYQFEYVEGSLENTFLNESSDYVLEQRGIQEHVCDILEGGQDAFEKRKEKYNI